MPKKLSLLFVVLLLISASSTARAASPAADLTALDSYVQTVQRESMFDPSTKLLMEGAGTALRAYLSDHGFRPSTRPLPTTVDAFRQEFQEATAAHPDIDTVACYQSCLKGMLAPLKEPYTRYLTPVEYQHLQARVEGTDEAGLGVRVEFDPAGTPTVAEVFEGSPGEQGGLRPGDRLARINDTSTRGLGLQATRDLLGGPEGSTVRVTLVRGGNSLQASMVRRRFETPSVTWKMLASHVGYIRLHAFSQNVAQEMDVALESLEKAGARAWVVDLRDNRGGYVTSAIDVCSRFLSPSTLVMTFAKKRQAGIRYTTYKTEVARRPVVLLVNARTASASEIVAGAMQDHQAATLVGTRTFGKGLVQKVIPLPDGSAFAISTGGYLTPSGRDLHKRGVLPDVLLAETEFAPIATDLLIQKAVGLLEARQGTASGK